MTKRTSIIMGGMAAAVALTAAAGSASAATTVLYGGGSTLVEKVYRDLFNKYGNTAASELCTGLVTATKPCPTSNYNSGVAILYVGVGSGNGLKGLENADPSLYVSGSKVPDAVPVPSTDDFGTFYGTGTGLSWVPATQPTTYFPKVTFSGSDNTLGSSDITTASGSSLGNNPLIQIPGIVAAIAVPFKPAANWNPKGVTVAGASSKVQLSTNTLCGIFTGKITVWNHPLITKDNGGVRLGTGKITVVYRHDSSGTTFLFSNALVNQCGTVSRRTKSQFPIPNDWLSDNSLTAQSTTTKPYYKSGTSFFINVFTHNHLPANFYNDNGGASGVTGGANGSGGVKTIINATVGSIGYVSPDFVQPVDGTGPLAANLQTYATFNAGTTPVYKAPTAANAIPIMAATKPPAFPGPAGNPLNWGAVNPLPTSATAYPSGGFSYIDLHRCYTAAADVAALVGTTTGSAGYLTWYYGSNTVNAGAPANILAADGFAPVPATWVAAINRLLAAPTIGIAVVGTKGCTAVTHGA